MLIASTALNAGGTHVNVGTVTSSTLTVGYSSPNITINSPGGVASSNFEVQANTVPGTDPVVPSALGVVTVNGAAVANHSVVLETRSRAANAYNIEVQQATTSASTDATKSGVSHYNSTDFTTDANGFVSLSASALTDLHTSKFIVSAGGTADGANYTTIQSAITAASSGDTVFVMTGTYTENLTLKVGVNVTSFTGEANTPNVTIIGNATLSTAGTVSISNIRLQTNSAPLLTVSGSVVSILNLTNCYLNCTNNTGISLTSSGLSRVNLISCGGNLATTGIAYFSQSSFSSLTIEGGTFTNTGTSTTANTVTGNGNFIFKNTDFQSVLSATTDSASFIIKNSLINITSATLSSFISAVGVSLSGSSGTLYANNSAIGGGTSSAVSIGAGTVGHIYDCTINSSNTNAITGAGEILYSNLAFTGTSSTINTTTKTIAGTIQGSKNTAPTLGFLGEQIRNYQGAGALANTVTSNVLSISLSPGIWDVSLNLGCVFSASTGTYVICAISTTSLGLGTQNDNRATITLASGTLTECTLTVPSYRLTLSSTTTVYGTGNAGFSSGTCAVSARLSATRVG